MSYAVEVQYFKQPAGDIVMKELSIISIDNDMDPIVLLFKPQFPWRRLTAKYKRLHETVHGLCWYNGECDYFQLGYLIRD